MKVCDLGRIDYLRAVEHMEQVLADRHAGRCEDTLLLCEHDPVYTVGRARGATDNVLAPGDVPVISTARGGDVTFHGPGQIVGYPILALPEHRHDLHGVLRGLESVLIRTLATYGVSGCRDSRNTGVWVEGRKIAAIGIACRKWVTWHGFALNVDTDLQYYQRIRPCGLESELVTRLSDHLTPAPSVHTVAHTVSLELQRWWEDWTQPSD